MKNKSGLSEIVATVIIIVLSIAAISIIWSMTSKFITEKTEGTGSCFKVGFAEKVGFNGDYTCYDSANDEVQFSIYIADVDIQKAVVTISAGGSSKSFEIENIETSIASLYNYPNRSANIKLPAQNAGLTYIATGINEVPEWIKIAPYMEDKQCDVTDTIYDLADCSLFD